MLRNMQQRSTDLILLGDRIRAHRKRIGFSQEKFAQHAGVDRSYMGAVERGERNITFRLMCDVAVALDCDLGELLKGLPTRT